MSDNGLHDEGSHVDLAERELTATDQFSRPAEDVDRFRTELATMREDDPPADVPRDQYERPLIVLPDGSDVLAYTRASKYGIKDKETLHRWGKRNVVFGMSRTHALVVRAQAVPALTGKDNIKELQDIAARAEQMAGADYGAMTGSALHLLTQRRDAGEDLSWVDPLTLAAMNAYTTLLDPEYFEILASETFVVHDDLRGAGSFDRVVRLRRRIVWPDGEVWPAGMTVVIDVKTGKISSMSYWSVDFTAQQLTYAEGEPYLPGVTHLADPAVRSAANVVRVTDQPGRHGRIGWDAIGVPGGPSRDRSLILHVPAGNPEQSHWERIDLEQARADADACRALRERWRTPRAQRFLALPALALTIAGTGDEIRDSADSDSGMSGPADRAAAKRAETTEVLRERLRRATSTDAVDALYDAWHESPVWSDALTDQCQIKYDELTPPEDVIDCPGCNGDTHWCRACGTGVPHGIVACAVCSLRIALDEAESADRIETLYLAHGPAGDGIWADEHNTASQAAWDRVSPPDDAPVSAAPLDDQAHDEQEQAEAAAGPPFSDNDSGEAFLAARCHRCVHRTEDGDPCDAFTPAYLGEWPDILHRVPISTENPVGVECDRFTVGEPATVHEWPAAIDGTDRFTDDPVPPADPAQYPMTIEQVGYGVITLHCHECLLPPGHPQADDPLAWCDCADGETCLDESTACRNRAHDPDDCPSMGTLAGNAADPESCAEHGPHGGTALCPGCIEAHRQETAVAQQGAVEATYAEPFQGPDDDPAGPFDDTAALAALRKAIADAPADRLDDVIGALHDAHGPTGDDLWDDECTTRAQARYDALEGAPA